MLNNKLQKMFNNEKGSGLVLTLMVLLVLSVLGATAGAVTINSNRLSHRTQDSNSAYYIAEAGANLAYDEIESKILEAYSNSALPEQFFQKIPTLSKDKYEEFAMQSGEYPVAFIEVSPPEIDGYKSTYVITSKGKIGNNTRTVTKKIAVNWVDKSIEGGNGIPTVPAEAALISKSKLSLLNGTVLGKAYISSAQKNAVKLAGGQGGSNYTIVYSTSINKGEILDSSSIYEPYPSFEQKDVPVDWVAYASLLEVGNQFTMPTETKKHKPLEYAESPYNKYWVIDHDGNINMNSWMLDKYILSVEENLYIPSINIGSGKKLILDTSKGNYTLYIDNLSVMSGTLEIKGSGEVTLVVRNSTSFNHNSYINQTGNMDQLRIVYTGNAPNFSEITSMNGHVLSVGSRSNITINNSTINGIVITDANQVNFTGGNAPSNMMMIAPNANIVLGSGYNIRGTLIGNEVTTTGGGTIHFRKIDSKYTSTETEQSSKVSLNDLISGEPAFESSN